MIDEATGLLTDALRHPSDGIAALLPARTIDARDVIPSPRIVSAFEHPAAARGTVDQSLGDAVVLVQPFDSGRGSSAEPVWSPGARDYRLELQLLVRYSTIDQPLRNIARVSAVLRAAFWSLARVMQSSDGPRRVRNGIQLVDARSVWIWPMVLAETDAGAAVAAGLLVQVRDTTPFGPGGLS